MTLPPTSLAVQGARVYPSPDAPPIEDCTVLVREGRIVSVGAGVSVPPGTPTLSAEGRVLTAGFWNAHVHFTEQKWRSSARASATVLNGQLSDMLTSRGFTTVVDAGSDPRSTLPLRQRVASGELLGPSIYTAGPGLFPPRGLPFYLRENTPFWIQWMIPQPSTPAAAERAVRRNIARGADLVKLFTGSYVERGRVATMPEPVARAACNVAHEQHQLVYSHPSNLEGTRIAIQSGVDVLAHPPDTTEGVDTTILRQAAERRMALIPTLKMFATTVTTAPEYLDPICEVVHRFRTLGGQVLFGTDVGYMADYRTEDEFHALVRSGLDPRAILAALTTAPSARFGVAGDRGTVAVGQRADLVLLDGDPFADVGAFARVRATVGAGRVLYCKPD
jgi:imidazolonepropionase-like amidohydrolase